MKRRFLQALLLALPAFFAIAAGAQSGAPATAASSAGLYRIAGKVINSVTEEPVRRATVSLLTEEDEHAMASTVTDNEGRFVLERIPAGKYPLTASKRGYRTAFFEEHEEYNSAIVTGPDQDTEHLVFRLTPGAQIHGVVTADGGDPVENAQVMLFRIPKSNRLGYRIQRVAATETDDTGAYEFGNLEAREYYVAVKADPWYAVHRAGKSSSSEDDPGAQLDVAYPVTFYDSTTDEASATRIALTGGSHQEINLNLHAVQALRLTLPGAETPQDKNQQPAPAMLRQTVFGTEVFSESSDTTVTPQGTQQEFTGVAPGHYELLQGQGEQITSFDASSSKQIDPGSGIPTVPVTGIFRSSTGAALPKNLSLELFSNDDQHPREPVQGFGTKDGFQFNAVPPGEWRLWAATTGQQPEEIYVLSTMINGVEFPGNVLTVKDRPVTLTALVSTADAHIQGFAKKDGKPLAGAMIVLVPKNPGTNYDRFRRDQSDSDGSFNLREVTPGQYTIVAIEDGWELDWGRAEVISRYLLKGIPVTVTAASGKLVKLDQSVPVQPR